MELYSYKQFELNEKVNEFDLFIAATGYETRASFLAKKNINANKKIALAFKDNVNNSIRVKNDLFFKNNGFELIEISGSDDLTIIQIIQYNISLKLEDEYSILIDYSSMTRVLYGAIIKFINTISMGKRKLSIYFSYCVAKFTPLTEEESATFNFYPIKNYCNLSLPQKPTALIAGLGYEKKRVFGLREFFDAEALYIFYTGNNDYTNIVEEKNKEVLASVKVENTFQYQINDLVYTKMLLQDLCETLIQNFRIIIAPCGPKPFTLLSFIIANNIPNIDVWRISAGDDDSFIIDRKPSGEVITVELIYVDKLILPR